MSIEAYEMDGDGYGRFWQAGRQDRFVYQMPPRAELLVQPASELAPYLVQDGVAYAVLQDPPTMQYDRGGQEVRDTMNESFPPAGGHYIFVDGTTVPNNLRELIHARVRDGWKISEQLQQLLALSE